MFDLSFHRDHIQNHVIGSYTHNKQLYVICKQSYYSVYIHILRSVIYKHSYCYLYSYVGIWVYIHRIQISGIYRYGVLPGATEIKVGENNN